MTRGDWILAVLGGTCCALLVLTIVALIIWPIG